MSKAIGSESATGDGGAVDGVRREQAAQLLAELQELAIVDWVHKEDVQRRMRQAVKRSLRGSHYPREQIEALTSR